MTSAFDAIRSLRPGAEFLMTDNVITWVDTEQTQPTDAQVAAEITRLDGQRKWDALRTKRNQLLAETDWEIVKHKELGTNIPTALKTYRQELRDLPANTSDPANPSWPVKP